jgi:hypothetical protein
MDFNKREMESMAKTVMKQLSNLKKKKKRTNLVSTTNTPTPSVGNKREKGGRDSSRSRISSSEPDYCSNGCLSYSR